MLDSRFWAAVHRPLRLRHRDRGEIDFFAVGLAVLANPETTIDQKRKSLCVVCVSAVNYYDSGYWIKSRKLLRSSSIK